MYTNIDVDHSIEIIRRWFTEFNEDIPSDIPTNLIISALEIVMNNNIFTFGDTFWRKKLGTAMGTPCACMIASIYFAYHERKTILPKYTTNILFYKRFIDDVFCLWYDKDNNDTNVTESKTFKEFKDNMNNFGNLKWEFEALTMTTTFLDLNINLTKRDILNQTTDNFYKTNFSTYQKPMNLYLYIPPHSAHLPGVIRSLIFSQIKKYWQQNTNSDDFIKMIRAFFQCLLDRGHNRDKVREVFLQTAHQLVSNHNNSKQSNKNKNQEKSNDTYLKWPYHPADISQKTIQQIYKAT